MNKPQTLKRAFRQTVYGEWLQRCNDFPQDIAIALRVRPVQIDHEVAQVASPELNESDLKRERCYITIIMVASGPPSVPEPSPLRVSASSEPNLVR